MKSVFQQSLFNVNIRLCIPDWIYFFIFIQIKNLIMGKGDKKTKKGKRHIGSSGVKRSKKKKKARVKAAKTKKAAPKKAAKKAKK